MGSKFLKRFLLFADIIFVSLLWASPSQKSLLALDGMDAVVKKVTLEFLRSENS
jgi:hypothetical protein